MGTFEERYVDTALGRVHLVTAGSGPSVTLLHSNGHSWREFEKVLGDLAAQNSVIAWDMPGQGDSDPVGTGVTIQDYASALAEALTQANVAKTVVIGCSVGGFIAAAAGRVAPTVVQGVGLVEMHFGGPEHWSRPDVWQVVETLFTIPTQTESEIRSRFVTQPTEAEILRWNIDRNKAGTRTLLGVMEAIRDFDLAGTLPETGVETAVLFGDSGPTIESIGDARALLAPDSTFSIVKDAGHFVTADAPEKFVAFARSLVDRSIGNPAQVAGPGAQASQGGSA